jgi:4-amino-4-deoxy-L-arabinose transferase-like glycosyltransferase
MELLSYRLGWMDPIDAFHVPKILLAGVLLAAVFAFARARFGSLVAWLAVVFLGAFPRFWGDMHYSPLDIPETVFFGLTVMVFSLWYDAPSRRRALGVGLLAGCALSIKGNALFLPVVLVLGALPREWSRRPWVRVFRHVKMCSDQYVVIAVTALIMPFLLWPYLYSDPARMLEYWGFISSQGDRLVTGWNWDPLIQTVATMPEVMLALVLVGFVAAG